MPFPTAKFDTFLKHRKEFIQIEDTDLYKRARVQLHWKGIVLRDEVEGATIKTKSQQVAHQGELLVAEIDAKVGGVGIVPPELGGAIVSSHYFLFEINASKCLRPWLDWFIRSGGLADQFSARGSTNYAAIRPHHVLNCEMPLPRLDEQRRIVSRIESFTPKIEQARALRASSQEESRLLPPSTFAKAYDEAVKIAHGTETLDDLCHTITDGTHMTPRYVSEGVPFLSVKDITSGTIRFDNTRYITQEEHAFLTKRCKPQRDDVLLTKVGTTGFAKAIDVDQEFSIFVCLALLKLKKDRLLPKFTEYMLNSSRLRALSTLGTRGVGNQNLVLKFICKFPMPAPALQEQLRIVKYLDGFQEKIDATKKLQSETAAELDALMPSILSRAFRGEL